MLNQSQFMREFNETHREEFNPQLFERDNTEIVEAIKQVVEDETSSEFLIKPVMNKSQRTKRKLG